MMNEPLAYLRDAGGTASDGEHDKCWIPCAKDDPGAVAVVAMFPSVEAPLGTLDYMETRARALWSDTMEDRAKFGAAIPLPTLDVPVDVLCNLIARSRAIPPMTDEFKESVARVSRHVLNLQGYATQWRQQASQVAGGQHMISRNQEAKSLVARAHTAEQQAADFCAILGAIPEPEITPS